MNTFSAYRPVRFYRLPKSCGAMLSLMLSLFTAASISPAASAEPVEYTLTRQYGSVFFNVMFEEYLDLVGRFDDYSATMMLDVEDLANSSLEASVQMGSLDMADSDVTETLVNSSAWFNASLFPEAVFQSSSARAVDEHTVEFSGDLKFMGTTQPWTMTFELLGGKDGSLEGRTIGVRGKGTLNRLDFGLDKYRNMAADMVTIEVNAKFNQ